MPDFLEQANAARLAIFLGLLFALIVLERAWPRRGTDMQRRLRWPSNFALVLIDSALLATLPLAAIGTALWAAERPWGLFNLTPWPFWLELLLAWVLLDLAIYWQHRLLHEIRWLWPLHRVHHSDIEFDTTTGVRFHPAEILLSMGWKMLIVLLIGAPALAVLLLETTLSSFALFSHANLRLPLKLDHALRWLVITPDMHRIHHSIHRAETDSNYGNCLTVWDRLFRSYVENPRDDTRTMRIGIPEFRAVQQQHFGPLLTQPWRRETVGGEKLPI